MKTTMTFLLLTTLTTSAAMSLESLLSSHIAEAQCAARCSTLEVVEQVEQCMEVCRHLLTSPSSLLCSLPHLCGSGCQAACSPPSSQPATLSPLTISPCTISWHLSSSLPATFLLAATDAGGRWHLAATTTATSLPTSLASTYSSLTLLAVTSSGLVATTTAAMAEGLECTAEAEVLPTAQASAFNLTFILEWRNLTLLALPATLALALLLLLALLLKCRRARLQAAATTNHVRFCTLPALPLLPSPLPLQSSHKFQEPSFIC